MADLYQSVPSYSGATRPTPKQPPPHTSATGPTTTDPSLRAALRDSVVVSKSASPREQPQRLPPASQAYDQPFDIIAEYSASAPYGRSETPRSKAKAKAKSSPLKGDKEQLDIIDRLDISGLYGGGALHRHDGPYAAVQRKPSTKRGAAAAPAAAVASAPPVPATPAEADASDTYPPLHGRSASVARRKPDAVGSGPGTTAMGYPMAEGESGGKGAQLIEAFGVRENEAFQDFGVMDYADDEEDEQEDTVQPLDGAKHGRTMSREERMLKTQSIWDIEATLREGRPVKHEDPPMPFFNSELYETDPDARPARTKSLVARIRSKKDVGSPIQRRARAGSEQLPMRGGVERDASEAGPPPVPYGAYSAGAAQSSSTTNTASSSQSPEMPAPQDVYGGYGAGGSPTQMARKPSMLQRIFSTRRKNAPVS